MSALSSSPTSTSSLHLPLFFHLWHLHVGVPLWNQHEHENTAGSAAELASKLVPDEDVVEKRDPKIDWKKAEHVVEGIGKVGLEIATHLKRDEPVPQPDGRRGHGKEHRRHKNHGGQFWQNAAESGSDISVPHGVYGDKVARTLSASTLEEGAGVAGKVIEDADKAYNAYEDWKHNHKRSPAPEPKGKSKSKSSRPGLSQINEGVEAIKNVLEVTNAGIGLQQNLAPAGPPTQA